MMLFFSPNFANFASFHFFMSFQLILPVLLFPTNYCFHDQKVSPHPGVLGITWSPLNIGIYLYWNEPRNAEFSFPQPWEIWNQPMFLDIPFLERHTDWERLMQKLEICWWCLYVLSKTWANFMFYYYSFSKIWSKTKAKFWYLKKKKLHFLRG